jgi:hypothetical protein
MNSSRVLSAKKGDDDRTGQDQFDEVDDHPKNPFVFSLPCDKRIYDPYPMWRSDLVTFTHFGEGN